MLPPRALAMLPLLLLAFVGENEAAMKRLPGFTYRANEEEGEKSGASSDEIRNVGGTNFHRRVQRAVRRRRVASYLREKRDVRERVLVYVPE